MLKKEVTAFPHIVGCYSQPVILQLGTAVFVGQHLLSGYPDGLPDRLMTVLDRLHDVELQHGYRYRWIAAEAVHSSWAPPVRPDKGLFDTPIKAKPLGRK